MPRRAEGTRVLGVAKPVRGGVLRVLALDDGHGGRAVEGLEPRLRRREREVRARVPPGAQDAAQAVDLGLEEVVLDVREQQGGGGIERVRLGEPRAVEAAVRAQKNLEPAEGVLRQVRAQLGREHGKLREQGDVCSISRVRRWLHL